jgi:hypothetical protein
MLVVLQPEPPSQPAMALLHRGASSRDVVLLPAGTFVEVPGAGPRSLAEALAATGADGLATSVANVLGTRIPGTLTASPSALARLVEAVGGVRVDVPETVKVEENGLQRTVFQQGRTRMNGGDLLRFMTLSVPGQNELERVARQNAGWRGLLSTLRRAKRDRVAAAAEPWDGSVSGADAARVLSALSADRDVNLSTLPVTRVGVSQTDRYDVDREALPSVRKSLSDVLTRQGRAGRRIRLLIAADGAVGPAVARILVEAGYTIELSGRASQPYDVTRAVITEDSESLRQTARRVLNLLGAGKLALSRAPQTLVDVTLVVGRDWARAHGFPQPPVTPAPKKR